MEFLDKIIAMFDGWSTSSTFVVVAGLVDFALRLLKTEKPIGVIHMIAGMLSRAGDVMKKASELLDKILPQRLK